MSDHDPVHKRRPRHRRGGLLRDTRAATAIEYGLILALVVITMIASLQNVAGITVGMWGNVSTSVQNAH